jgi:hypothetical protein
MAKANMFVPVKFLKRAVGRPNTKYQQCVAYWKEYLDACAPRPNKTMRLFPSILALKHQYKLNFLGLHRETGVDRQGHTQLRDVEKSTIRSIIF